MRQSDYEARQVQIGHRLGIQTPLAKWTGPFMPKPQAPAQSPVQAALQQAGQQPAPSTGNRRSNSWGSWLTKTTAMTVRAPIAWWSKVGALAAHMGVSRTAVIRMAVLEMYTRMLGGPSQLR